MLFVLLYFGLWFALPYIFRDKIRRFRYGITIATVVNTILSFVVGSFFFADMFMKLSFIFILFSTYITLKKPSKSNLIENKNKGILSSKLSITKMKK